MEAGLCQGQPLCGSWKDLVDWICGGCILCGFLASFVISCMCFILYGTGVGLIKGPFCIYLFVGLFVIFIRPLLVGTLFSFLLCLFCCCMGLYVFDYVYCVVRF